MNKQDYISMINYGCTSITCKKGLFELVENYFKLKESYVKLNSAFGGLYNVYYHPEPYKFKDLKAGMWVFDIKNKTCRKIIGIYDNNDNLKLIEFDDGHTFEFEENRFYPLTKAMEENNE